MAWTILFKDASTGNRALRLGSEGELTSRKMFAVMFPDKERAEQIAADIRTEYPEATVTVKPF